MWEKQVLLLNEKLSWNFFIYFLILTISECLARTTVYIAHHKSYVYIFFTFLFEIFALAYFSLPFFSLKATHTHHIFRKRKKKSTNKKNKIYLRKTIYMYTNTCVRERESVSVYVLFTVHKCRTLYFSSIANAQLIYAWLIRWPVADRSKMYTIIQFLANRSFFFVMQYWPNFINQLRCIRQKFYIFNIYLPLTQVAFAHHLDVNPFWITMPPSPMPNDDINVIPKILPRCSIRVELQYCLNCVTDKWKCCRRCLSMENLALSPPPPPLQALTAELLCVRACASACLCVFNIINETKLNQMIDYSLMIVTSLAIFSSPFLKCLCLLSIRNWMWKKNTIAIDIKSIRLTNSRIIFYVRF